MKSNNEAAECKLEQLAVKVGYNSSVDTDEQLETIMEEEEEREREEIHRPVQLGVSPRMYRLSRMEKEDRILKFP